MHTCAIELTVAACNYDIHAIVHGDDGLVLHINDPPAALIGTRPVVHLRHRMIGASDELAGDCENYDLLEPAGHGLHVVFADKDHGRGARTRAGSTARWTLWGAPPATTIEPQLRRSR